MDGSLERADSGEGAARVMINSIATPQKSDTLVTREFDVNVRALTDAAADLLISKHRDYGPLNISRSPGGPLNGLRVRIWDKLARINNLLDTGATPEHESLRDSFIDLANYSLIAVMVLEGTWPNE